MNQEELERLLHNSKEKCIKICDVPLAELCTNEMGVVIAQPYSPLAKTIAWLNTYSDYEPVIGQVANAHSHQEPMWCLFACDPCQSVFHLSNIV